MTQIVKVLSHLGRMKSTNNTQQSSTDFKSLSLRDRFYADVIAQFGYNVRIGDKPRQSLHSPGDGIVERVFEREH